MVLGGFVTMGEWGAGGAGARWDHYTRHAQGVLARSLAGSHEEHPFRCTPLRQQVNRLRARDHEEAPERFARGRAIGHNLQLLHPQIGHSIVPQHTQSGVNEPGVPIGRADAAPNGMETVMITGEFNVRYQNGTAGCRSDALTLHRTAWKRS